MSFQMQSWSSREEGWEAMEDGAAGHVWRPRETAALAAEKCHTWTGGIGIPAMQVVDLSTGLVVWRDSRQYPDAGWPIELEGCPATDLPRTLSDGPFGQQRLPL